MHVLIPIECTFLYGLCLGSGIGTQKPAVTYYVLLLMLFRERNVLLAMATMAVFGLARALPLVIFSRSAAYQHLDARVTYWTGVVKMINGLVLAACGVALLTTAALSR
jgi:hypothetical protein